FRFFRAARVHVRHLGARGRSSSRWRRFRHAHASALWIVERTSLRHFSHLQNLFPILRDLIDRRLSCPREIQLRRRTLYASRPFGIARSGSVGTRIVSQLVDVKWVFIGARTELSAHHGSEYLGVGVNQSDFLLRRRWPRRINSRRRGRFLAARNGFASCDHKKHRAAKTSGGQTPSVSHR